QAQALVLAGLVPGYDKPGTQVDEAVEVSVERPPPYVSRGGEKLANALDHLRVDPAGLDCLDVGASTGGFTDVLLQRGAARVIAGDVSFIAVRKALPPALRLAAPGWQAVVLVKPQFEAGRADVGKGGVVRDPEVRRRVLRGTAEAALGWGASVAGVVDSGLPGPKGKRELFLHLVSSGSPAVREDLDARIDDALAESR